MLANWLRGGNRVVVSAADDYWHVADDAADMTGELIETIKLSGGNATVRQAHL